MVCLFCGSYHHESKFCDKYVTDDNRKVIAEEKKFCHVCFIKSSEAHLPDQEKCKSNEKCVGWFSTEHHALFCPERIKAFKKLFLPKIDQNLLQRFLKIFDIDEKYSMVLSSPKNEKLVSLNKIKIMDSFDEFEFDESAFSGGVVVINDYMKLYEYKTDKKFIQSINAGKVICLPKALSIAASDISADFILLLLSPYTKSFHLHAHTRSNINIKFLDIVKKAPNLQKFYLHYARGAIIEKTWLQDLIKYKNGKNLHDLFITLDTIELDIESLIEVINKKCTTSPRIDIKFILPSQALNFKNYKFLIKNYQRCAGEISKKLEKYYDYCEKREEQTWLHLEFCNLGTVKTFSLNKSQKNYIKKS